MNVEKRIEVERKIVQHLVETMIAAGWHPTKTYDGGGWVKTTTHEEVADTVFSVDESQIQFVKGDCDTRLRRSVVIVLGNDGYDCIADHALSNPVVAEDDFETTINAVCAWADELQEQDASVPKPPPGYTAEELELDNPYNAWMRDAEI